MSCQLVIAERGVNLGFPEALFHTFPGMGAYSLISRRLDAARAEKLILGGRMFKSEDFLEMGLIDHPGRERRGPRAGAGLYRGEYQAPRVAGRNGQGAPPRRPLTLEELRDVTDIWVETVLNLAPINLRKMEMLALSQDRLFEQAASQRFQKES